MRQTQKAQLFEAIIEQVKKNTGVDPLKSLLAGPRTGARPGLSVQGLPLHRHQPPGVLPAAGAQQRGAERDAQIRRLVVEVRLRQPRIGTRKLHHLLACPLRGGGYQDGA